MNLLKYSLKLALTLNVNGNAVRVRCSIPVALIAAIGAVGIYLTVV